MKKRIDLTIEILLFIVLFSVFINAKAIFNLGLAILVLLGILKAVKYKDIVKEKMFYWYFGLILIGISTNYKNGTVSDFLSLERGVFFIPLFILLNVSLFRMDRIKSSLIYGALVGSLYSVISYFTPKIFGIVTLYDDYRANGNRMQSFSNVIRWGSLLQMVLNFLPINLMKTKKWYKIIYTVFIFVLFLGALIINGTRAGLVGFILGIVFLFISLIVLYREKVFKYLVGFLILVSLFGSYAFHKNPALKDRVLSITSLTHPSNRIRLDLYRISLDIMKEKPVIGHGSENSTEVFNEFIKKQTEEYREKYYNNSIKIGSGTPFENNYINLAVENGIPYLLFYIGFYIYFFFFMLKKMKVLKNRNKIKLLIVLSSIFGQRVFTFFFPGTDSYMEFIVTFLIFYAYEISNEKQITE